MEKHLEVAKHVGTLVRHGIMQPHLATAVIRHHAPHLSATEAFALMHGGIAEPPRDDAAIKRMRAMYPYVAKAGMSKEQAADALTSHVRKIASDAWEFARQGYIAPHHAQDLARRAAGGMPDMEPTNEQLEQDTAAAPPAGSQTP